MKPTKKKPAKKTTERNHRFKSANGEAAHNTARLFLDRCTTVRTDGWMDGWMDGW